jgi:hypothetical protein
LGDSDVLSSALRFSKGGALEVLISDKGGRVEGAVRPGSPVQVVLIPNERRDRAELFKAVAATADGRFAFTGVAPGDYKLFAWENLEPYSYFDPEFVKRFEDVGQLLSVSESSTQSVNPRVVSGDLQ